MKPILLLLALVFCAACSTNKNSAGAQVYGSEGEELVSKASDLLAVFNADIEVADNKELFKDIDKTHAIFIIPNYLKGGFFIGGEGGSGVMLVRRGDGNFSSPSFFKLGGVSLGINKGIIETGLVLLLKDKRDLKDWLDSGVTFSADVGGAVGHIGGLRSVQSGVSHEGNIKSWGISKGYYAGANVGFMVLSALDDLTRDFYKDQQLTSENLVAGSRRVNGSGWGALQAKMNQQLIELFAKGIQDPPVAAALPRSAASR